ncbi:MAG: multicomponent Na+:H+ antiporter subunit D, partial [Gammaproteobacteria bacterium]
MSFNELLPVFIVATSAVCGLLILCLGNEQVRLRTTLNLTGASVKLALVIVLLIGVRDGESFGFSIAFAPGLEFVLRADPLSLLFTALSSVLWLITTIYAVGYLENGLGRSRFFAFFSFCVSATVGVSLAGNLFTFLIFYELLTLVTWPLVAHRGSKEAVVAARIYLIYTLGGGLAVLGGFVLIHVNIGTSTFVEGGIEQLRELPHGLLFVIFALLIGGFGVKAALFPMHGWLPRAMVAPAPVSALLHAVAVVKAG